MNLTQPRWTIVVLTALACLLLTLSTGIQSSTAVDGVLYVKPGATGGCGNWDDACDLQVALGTASAGQEIWVAEGIHKPTSGTDRTATFLLRNGVAVYGGFAGSEGTREERDWTLHQTILSGDLLGNDNDNVDPTEPTRADNSYHVVTGSGTDVSAILDGFTISGGNAADYPSARGGGKYNEDGGPTVRHAIFSGNTDASSAQDRGGGMYNLVGSPTVRNVIFSNNSAGDWAGGGMENEDNSNPTLVNVTFSGNSAGNGGGMSNDYDSNPMLVNVTFSGNSADYWGGGMSNWYSSPTLVNVTFSENSADYGGGMDNRNSSPTLTNCILWGNSATSSGGQIYKDGSSTLTVSYSDIKGGYGGTENIDADPQFVDPDGADDIVGTLDDDLHLQSGSPAIDAGENSALPVGITTDLDGNPRIVNGVVDMGAYEAQLQMIYLPLVLKTYSP